MAVSNVRHLHRAEHVHCERCEELEARIRDLEHVLHGLPSQVARLRQAVKIRLLAAKVAVILANRGMATRQGLWSVFYGDRPDGGPDPKIFDALVWQARRALAPYGIVIEMIYGQGWSMPEASRARLKALLEGQ